MGTLPNFLIVGAARSGTTALYNYLGQHPNVFMSPEKEPCFFTFARKKLAFKKGRYPFIVTDLKKYKKLFRKVSREKAIGEASTAYLYYFQDTIRNIYKLIPHYRDLKIVIILRNPVERAFSQYMFKVRQSKEPLDFNSAIEQEQQRMKSGYGFDYFYVDRGFYYKQVKAYLSAFRNVKIFLYEELLKDADKLMEELFQFLDVESYPIDTQDRIYNTSGVPRNRIVSNLVNSENTFLYRLKAILPAPLKTQLKEIYLKYNTKTTSTRRNPATCKKLQDTYREDILSLERLIDRDLSGWLT